ncbi:hypothetical protein B879_00222 [Cecembia lonarensis LW9]|uniref:Uncharacterized protein n=1 Tax=Cecembia lonarensis (strain CCUG 58316 / KCTC 22772 / LW9) TaxID=1225176 RepID=K1L943_CECL9|nr:hypothetical protein B879_00222 [Cecembia lonarensis LW9]
MDKPFRIADQNAIQFLTLTVIDWIDIFSRKEYKLEIVDSLNYCIDQLNSLNKNWITFIKIR